MLIDKLLKMMKQYINVKNNPVHLLSAECLTVTVLALSWCHMTIRVPFRTFLCSRPHGTVKTTYACTTGNTSGLVASQPKHVLTLFHCQEAEIISRTENVFSLRVVIFLEQTHVGLL
jgi:hypothetical protein